MVCITIHIVRLEINKISGKLANGLASDPANSLIRTVTPTV